MRLRERPVVSLSTVLLLAGFLTLVVLNAWLSDDAYITFRTVDNFVHGYGLTWNVDERVQVYTHPLWMLLVSGFYAFTGEIFFTSLGISIALSFLAVVLIAIRGSRTPVMAMLAVAIFSLSKAFVDYATSGLENPLTSVILAAFLLVYLRRPSTTQRLFWLSLLTALGMLNRLDIGLLMLPALGVAFFRGRSRKVLVAGLLGFLPLVAWELFALLYYGSPVPNTAMAKLNAGLIPPAAIHYEGLMYLLNSVKVDPITLVVICLSVVLPVVAADWSKMPLVVGVVLYILYVVRVGGDFMSGRFLAAPLLQAVVIVVTGETFGVFLSSKPLLDRKTPKVLAQAGLFVALAVVGLSSPYTPLRASGAKSADTDASVWVRGRSITDERANYYHNTGLLEAFRRQVALPDHDWAAAGQKAREAGPAVVVKGSVGFYGFNAGPKVHVVDLLALGDPLLARLPVSDPNWQIGHFGRRPPQGYLLTLETGENHIADPNLAAYYDKLAYVTRGRFWDLARWREVWRLNTGAYDDLLDAYAYHRGASFNPVLRITNPTDRPYVYAYVWNNGAGETYLLDDASGRGRTYDVRWQITPEGVTFDGDAKAQIAQIGVLSDADLLNVGAFFADDASLASYEMYERRYWFRLDDAADGITVLLPGLEWANDDAPGGYWREMDVDAILGP